MKLIYEYQEPEIHIEESVNENKVPVKKYKIKGIFSTIGEKTEMEEYIQKIYGKKMFLNIRIQLNQDLLIDFVNGNTLKEQMLI